MAFARAGSGVAVLMMGFSVAAAQSYPTKPVRLVIPFPPGGGTDAVARVLAPKLSAAMGQQWVIDNRGGAAGNIAAEIVAHADADGYTVLQGFSTTMTVNKSLYRKIPFDPVRDFAPVTQTVSSQYMLTVHPAVPAKSVAELVALAKSKPGSLNFATAGVGSPLHLAGELLNSRAGIKLVAVPYKGGGPAAAAALAGEAQLVFSSLASAMANVRAGRIRALAVTGPARSKVFADLPTIAESGYPGYSVTTWQSMTVPAGTPAAVIRRIHDETVKVLALPDVVKFLHNTGYEINGTTPEKLAEIMRNESQIWAKVIREANIRAD